MPHLDDFGWDGHWQSVWDSVPRDGTAPARVAAVHRDALAVWTTGGERAAEVSGRLRHHAADESDLPAAGDWVAARLAAGDGPAVVQAILPRRTRIARKVPGATTAEQVVAANVDVVAIVAGLDHDYNPRRMERALVLAWDGGAPPLIVLNKADLRTLEALQEAVRETEVVAPGVPVLALSAADGRGLDGLAPWLVAGRTAALIGSSGAGKSTLVNRLLGQDRQRTAGVRAADSRGRHTTTHRELLRLPGGALLVDTPGLRELQLWAAPDALGGTFADVESLAGSCRFADCRHAGEPGCAVRAAVDSGRIDEGRLASFHKLQRELRHLALRQDDLGRRELKQRWRAVHKAARRHRPRE